MPADVTVVTAAFGCPQRIMEWASQWLSAGARCIVCDNGGNVPASLPAEVTVLPFTANTGFGSGINRAVSASGTSLVLVSNPDTLPQDRRSLQALAERHRKKTFSGGLTIDQNGNHIHSTGRWPDIPWVRKQVLSPAESLWSRSRVDWLQGSLILACREDFLELGGFCDTYPLYFEDVDLCAKAENAGVKRVFNPDCVFVHNEGTGSEGSSALRLSHFHWGLVEFFRRHRSPEYGRARRLVLLKCLLRAAVLAPSRPEVAAGYRAGFRAIIRGTPPPLPARAHG